MPIWSKLFQFWIFRCVLILLWNISFDVKWTRVRFEFQPLNFVFSLVFLPPFTKSPVCNWRMLLTAFIHEHSHPLLLFFQISSDVLSLSHPYCTQLILSLWKSRKSIFKHTDRWIKMEFFFHMHFKCDDDERVIVFHFILANRWWFCDRCGFVLSIRVNVFLCWLSFKSFFFVLYWEWKKKKRNSKYKHYGTYTCSKNVYFDMLVSPIEKLTASI